MTHHQIESGEDRYGSVSPVILLLRAYALAASIFFIFRLLLFFSEIGRIDGAQDSVGEIIIAFLIGLRYDLVICSYILVLPFLLVFMLDLLKKNIRLLRPFIFYYVFILFSIAFLVSAIDIPYFKQFFSRFSVAAFQWMDNPVFVVKMIAEEPSQAVYAIPWLLLVIVFGIVLKRIIRRLTPWQKRMKVRVPIYLLMLLLMFIGIRGQILPHKSPLTLRDTYFSDNAFLNQMGLNPVFTLLRSYWDIKRTNNRLIDLMDPEAALSNVKKSLDLTEEPYGSPIARLVEGDSAKAIQPNVVIVIMESMSAEKMKRHGNPDKLTPFLDSLSYQSLYFDNIYTAGKHTYNGIFGTLFSFPSIYLQHPMRQLTKYNGVANTLKQFGYNSIYFTTHDGEFDNVQHFLKYNGFDRVVCDKDYPEEEIRSQFGVPDEYMFRFALPILNDLAEKGSPFLSVLMTTSDHSPYYIPENFKPTAKLMRKQAVQYADWSLRRFMEMAQQENWFNNTLFVFVADHGAPLSAPYEISLDYHHSPLIFYAPSLLDTIGSIGKIGGQIDVFPTMMGLMNLPYINNTLGIDLMRASRPYVLVNEDDKLGVLDNDYFLIMKDGEPTKLYHYQDEDPIDYQSVKQDKVLEMETYARSCLQVFQDMLKHKQTFVE